MTDNVRRRPELLHETVYLAPGAIVVGDVTIGAESSVWFNAVLRGDCERIVVGKQSNIQDCCVLHADPGFPCTVGNGVTVGHGAVVHGATVEDNVTIGMKAVVMNGARIGANSIVGVGAVVTEGTEIPPNSLAVGVPAKVKRELSPEQVAMNHLSAQHYVENAKAFAAVKGDRA